MSDFTDGTAAAPEQTVVSDAPEIFGVDASDPVAENISATPPSPNDGAEIPETSEPVVAVTPDPEDPDLGLEEYTLTDLYELVTEIKLDNQVYQTQAVQYNKLVVSTMVLIVLAIALVAGILLARIAWKRM